MAMPSSSDIEMGGTPLLQNDTAHLPSAESAKNVLELAITGDLPEFQAQVVNHPLNLAARPDLYDDRTSLHMAALHGQVEIVKCIMTSPQVSVQVVNATDRFGYTPLHLAIRSKHESIVRILTMSSLTLPDRFLAANSIEGVDELGQDCDGFSPLHIAAAAGSTASIKLLLQRSAQVGTAHDPVNIHTTTWQGMTALDIAKQSNHVEVEQMLECMTQIGCSWNDMRIL